MGKDGSISAQRSDEELIAALRAGDSTAHAELFARHSDAATRVARIYARDSFSADDLVSEAFVRTVSAIQGGAGPESSFRAYLYTVLRRLAADQGERDKQVLATDDFTPFEIPDSADDPALDSFEKRTVSKAFASLPERWQAVLWYLEVERMPVAEIAPILGLTANGVSALGFRARNGLREAYLQEHVTAIPDYCAEARSRLGAYARGTLAKREKAIVSDHLDDCEECVVVLAELRDVGHGMRVVIAPLLLGGAATAAMLGWAAPGQAQAATLSLRGPRGRSSLLAGAAVAGVALVAGGVLALSGAFAPNDEPAASEPTVNKPTVTEPAIVPQPPRNPPTTPPTPSPEPPVTRDSTAPPSLPQPESPAGSAQVSVAFDDTGDLVLGRDGVVGATVSNTGTAAAASVRAQFVLPSGVQYDPSRLTAVPLPAGWTCAADAAGARCTAASLPAATTLGLRLPLTVGSAADTSAVPSLSVFSGSTALAAAVATAPVQAQGMSARAILDGSYSIERAGASFLGCDPMLTGCADARARTGSPSASWNNNSWIMQARGSSETDLTLPAGSTVVFAGLYWSGYRPGSATTADLASLELRAPGASGSVSVTASRTDQLSFGGRTAYQSFADVTSLVAAGGGGRWAASGAPLTTGADAYAGWALVVVVQDASLTASRVALFDGLAPVNGSGSASFDVAVLPGVQTTVGIVAWEGDAGTSGDSLLAGSVALVPSGGLRDASNAFDSTAEGFGDANAFGVDVKRFDPQTLTSSRVRLTATTAGDAYLVGAVTVESR